MSAFHTTLVATTVVGAGIWPFNGYSLTSRRRKDFDALRSGTTESVFCRGRKTLGELCSVGFIASLHLALAEPQRRSNSQKVLRVDFSARYSKDQYRIAATNSSSSSFPGSSGVEEEVKVFEDQNNDSVLSAEQRKATTSREENEDLASLVSHNGWASDREVAEADFAERDHSSNGVGVANVGDGCTFIRESSDESTDDSWERFSENNGGGDGAASSSSITSTASSVAAKEPVYEVIEINRNGIAVQKLVSRRQLLRTKGGLRLRDLRRVDPSLWVTNSAPALLVRDQAILLNLGSLRAIATPEDVLIFDHQSIGARGFLDILIPRLEADKTYGHSMPFELEVMESALISRTQRLERALMEVEPRVIALLEVLPTRLTADVLEELRLSKQALVEVGAKAGALRDMLLELLDTPQDIRRMTIMGSACIINREDGDVQCVLPQDKQVAEAEEEEIEMLLEYYLQRCESCHGQAEKLLSSAKEMEDSIAVNLSSRRLEVSRLELLLQVGTFCAALGALVAGIFGMNLKSYLEERAMAFWITTAGIILGGTFLYIYIVSYLKNRKIL
ncbi:hypothetical protein R1sor_005826 [Riccia sorocarpa]|uniref:Magnesium transporter n=1 Tax=Riccia sorocarpa TaxID=122646 RepID=A0ABD3HKN4_9MARC